MPETAFFDHIRAGNDMGDSLPLPEGIPYWNNANVKGVPVLAAIKDLDLFIIADEASFGLALFHYVYDNDNDSGYRFSYKLPYRVIQTERRIYNMAGSNPKMLNDLANRVGQNRGISQMDFGTTPQMQPVEDNISGQVDTRRLQREATLRGYVTGYIMGAAPATTLSLSTKTEKDTNKKTCSIVAKQSKPSRPLAVLMAIPAKCVRKGGSLATPDDIMAGTVDFNTTPSEEMIYQAFPLKAAIGYIQALGGQLPEYAPFTTDRSQHWTPEEISTNRDKIDYVRVVSSENKSKTRTERFRFNLKSTSSRRSLFTQKNHVCLRALEHIPVSCKDQKEAYEMNQAAFGRWQYSHPKTEANDALTKAIANCPSQIWRKKYTIDGEEKDGIGSVFFMCTPEEKTAGGETVMRRELTYFPWWQTGSLRQSSPSRVESIVKRVLRPAEGDKKETMVTVPLLWKDHKKHPMFAGYANFVKHIIDNGYIREETLSDMNTRSTKAKSKPKGLTPDQENALRAFLTKEDVIADIQSVQDEASDRFVLNGQ